MAWVPLEYAFENASLPDVTNTDITSYYSKGMDTEDIWSKTLGIEFPGPASFFYGAQAMCLVVLWIIVQVVGCGDFYRHALDHYIGLRPSWLPSQVFMFLHRRHVYLTASYSMVPIMLAAATFPDWWTFRWLVALVVTAYQLVESSLTFSHRDYLMLYNSWALAVLPDRYAEGLALGFSVHFIASSGFAKVLIGGRDWASPSTMRNILGTYGKLSVGQGGPWSPRLNRLIVDHDILSAGEGVFTLLFECVAVPLALMIPLGMRVVLPLFAASMVALHVGIFACQSALIGLFFTPNLASYAFGFGAHVYFGSQGWLPALLLCATSFGVVALRGPRLLPENWPLTPFALFGWSGSQWTVLFDTFVRGDTRLVLSAELAQDLVGLSVVKKCMRGATPARPGGVVYDAWDLCLGETTLQLDILDALDFKMMVQPDWDATGFTHTVEAWLRGSTRLVEISSGRPLLRAYFVSVTAEGIVTDVLAKGTAPLEVPLLA